MTPQVQAALFALVAAIIGGAIQAWSSRRFEVARFERQNRHGAYLTYLKGISRLSFAKDDDHLAALAVVAEARSRIALCGSELVVKRMIKVFDNGEHIYSASARADLAQLIAAMRLDSLGSDRFKLPDELFVLLFGREPQGL